MVENTLNEGTVCHSIAPWRQAQMLRPQRRVIAVSSRLREDQEIFKRSAIEELKELVTLANEEPVPIHRVEAWKGVMSDPAVSLEDRMGALR